MAFPIQILYFFSPRSYIQFFHIFGSPIVVVFFIFLSLFIISVLKFLSTNSLFVTFGFVSIDLFFSLLLLWGERKQEGEAGRDWPGCGWEGPVAQQPHGNGTAWLGGWVGQWRWAGAG